MIEPAEQDAGDGNGAAPGQSPEFGKWLDLMMLLVGGRERTKEEYGRLFQQAGLELKCVLHTSSELSILEGVRAS